MKNIITTIAMFILTIAAQAQSIIKIEVDTVQYFQMTKGKTIQQNLDSNLIQYQGFEYGRVDTWEIDLINKTVNFGVGENEIIKYRKNGTSLMIEYVGRNDLDRYFLVIDVDKKNNRKFVLYLKDENYGGGLSYIK